MLLAEMAAWYACHGMTLYDAMQKLYEKYGQFGEQTLNLVMPGLDGITKMRDLMEGLRKTPPISILGVEVVMRRDYQAGVEIDTKTDKSSPIELSGSNVLRFDLADGTAIIVRPSGTEPKVKVYILASGETRAECDTKVEKYTKWANALAE